MPQLGQLHLLDRGEVGRQVEPEQVEQREGGAEELEGEGEHQRQAGEAQRYPGQHHEPEDHFLAGVELARRRMRTPGEHPAPLPDPDPVVLAGNVFSDPEHHDQDQPDHEGEAEEVVGVLAH